MVSNNSGKVAIIWGFGLVKHLEMIGFGISASVYRVPWSSWCHICSWFWSVLHGFSITYVLSGDRLGTCHQRLHEISSWLLGGSSTKVLSNLLSVVTCWIISHSNMPSKKAASTVNCCREHFGWCWWRLFLSDNVLDLICHFIKALYRFFIEEYSHVPLIAS